MATGDDTCGAATSVEEVSIPQRAGEKRFTTRVELLESSGGERLVRFSHGSGGAVRRGRPALRVRDLAKLGVVLERAPEPPEGVAGGRYVR